MGSIITVICLVTTSTFIIPMLTIMPIALPLEELFSGKDYSKTSTYVLLSLITLFIATALWFYKKLENDRKKNKELNILRLTLFFSVQLFIVHPLVFYFWATMNSGSAGDGQFIFGIIKTFPISSFSFVIFGLIIDGLINRKTLANN